MGGGSTGPGALLFLPTPLGDTPSKRRDSIKWPQDDFALVLGLALSWRLGGLGT